MKSRPILFSAPMVQALLAGTKTQTRRVIKPQPIAVLDVDGPARCPMCLPPLQSFAMTCKIGQPGDRLWVKETYRTRREWDEFSPKNLPVKFAGESDEQVDWLREQYIHYETCPQPNGKLTGRIRQSIYMRQWMSRITLEITGVRVERLNDISEADCWAEGIEQCDGMFDSAPQAAMAKRIGCSVEDAKPLYACLWESINGPGSWDLNPWVWVIEFRKVTQ